MIRKIRRFLTVLLVVALFAVSFFLYGVYISVERINLNYESIASAKIPQDLNQVNIAFITDLHYNGFMNQERLTSMFEKINSTDPAVIIFGGDLFDDTANQMPDESKQAELLNLLKSLEAPLGKFAVLGEQDETSESMKEIAKSILYQADFELLENRSIRIRNESNSSITLFGIDSMVNGVPNIEQAFADINANEFNIVVTHCPDLISEIPTTAVDLMFAGHSHGGQIRIPFFGPIATVEGAKNYSYGTQQVGNTLLHISNGLGTTGYDMRLFAPPEVLIYRLIADQA